MTEKIPQKMKILIVRPDRIGDCILSLPVVQALKNAIPEARISVLVRPLTAPLFESHPAVSRVIRFEKEHESLGGALSLASQLKRENFGTAIVLQDHRWASAAVFFGGISLRVGPQSKFRSFLFFNQRLKQSRSESVQNEADYNLDLLDSAFPNHTFERMAPKLEILNDIQNESETLGPRSVWIHPGMGGSALNWEPSAYCELISKLLRDQREVWVSEGPSDSEFIAKVLERLPEGRVHLYRAKSGDSILKLGAMMKQAAVVVAPSTGPLHLAHALGVRTVGIYPPIQVQAPRRWGTYLDRERSALQAPDVACPAKYQCFGAECRFYPCMEQIHVDSVYKSVNVLLEQTGNQTE